MKTITRSKIYIPMAAMILTAAVAALAAGQQLVPFKGTFQGQDAVNANVITTTATGVGTHVGRLSLTDVVTITPSGNNGTGHWTAANGDSIYSTFVASAVFGDVVVTITEIHTITGGTGRFAGAQGTFKLERLHVRAPSADGTHVTFGSFEGNITAPGTVN